MILLTFALAITLAPTRIPQGQVVRITAPANAVSVRWNDKSFPLFPGSDAGSKTGFLPIPVLEAPGTKKVVTVDSAGRTLESASLEVVDARFRKQNVQLGAAVQGIRATPDEMETVAALRNTVSPTRYWSEPLALPTAGCMTSPFGVLRLHNGKPTGGYHGGLDQRGAEGVPIRAAADGIVKIVRKFNVHGDTVGIDHGQGVTSIYLHMSRFATTEGTQVRKGDLIGYIGTTGRSNAPHLHWSLNVHGVPVNPLQWVSLEPCAPKSAPAKRKPRRKATAR